MQSFVVWYKIIHSFIACLSFVILLNSTEETADESAQYVASDIIMTMDIVVFVIIASLSDGYPNDSKMMKVIKYGMFVLAILLFIYEWCVIYFEWNQRIQDYDQQFTLHIGKFGYKDSFSYKVMALSSFSKVLLVFVYNYIVTLNIQIE